MKKALRNKKVLVALVSILVIVCALPALSSHKESQPTAALSSSLLDQSSSSLPSSSSSSSRDSQSSSASSAVPSSSSSNPSSSRSSSPPAAVQRPQNVAPPSSTTPQAITVYITETGEKYHRSGCQYLRKSSISISLTRAKSQGYTPCSRCHPPR